MHIKINILILYFIGIIIAGNMNKSIIDKDVVIEKATFGAGCFWCVEAVFERLEGVVDVQAGYTGGSTENPIYKEVCTGQTGHAEVIQISFDPQKISYSTLVGVFWENIDPTVMNRQFCDIGNQYRTAIFYHNDEQKKQAEESKNKNQDHFSMIHTEIVNFEAFYIAEAYHQKFYKKNKEKYSQYEKNCGRQKRLKEIWQKKRKDNKKK